MQIIGFHIYSIKAIIGGQNAKPGEFSYIVSLRNETDLHYCGGVLITRKHVVTVAHCLYTDESTFKAQKEIKYQPKDVKVLVNTVYADGTQSKHSKTEIIPAKKLTPHPNYRVTDPSTIADDIAIITVIFILLYGKISSHHHLIRLHTYIFIRPLLSQFIGPN